MSARYSGRDLRYYDPGKHPQPRAPEFVVPLGTKKSRRLSKSRRLELLRAAGITTWSGRQWKRLRKQMRKAWKAEQRERAPGGDR